MVPSTVTNHELNPYKAIASERSNPVTVVSTVRSTISAGATRALTETARRSAQDRQPRSPAAISSLTANQSVRAPAPRAELAWTESRTLLAARSDAPSHRAQCKKAEMRRTVEEVGQTVEDGQTEAMHAGTVGERHPLAALPYT